MGSFTKTTIADGDLRGVREGDVVCYRSIPYAAPPVGELRLRAPQPVQPWNDVRDATRFGYAAIQHRKGAAIGPRKVQPTSEDCLTLNVVTPAKDGGKRPVMVFIHGGGYVLGTSALPLYSGKNLVHRGDIVYVSLNYRLGALGYADFSSLSTPKRRFDSNLGLRDQVAALQWVQRNIAAFGGDPDNVTIFGESAGAHAVTTLLATPSAAGLFHRAIAQSSPADWHIDADDAARWARMCVEKLGASEDNAATALSEADPHDIRRAANRVFGRTYNEQPGLVPMVPVVDSDFLPKAPLQAYADGSAHRVPLIIGTNRDEGALFQRFWNVLPTDPRRIATLFSQTDEEAHEQVQETYARHPVARASVRLGGDLVFWKPTLAVCESHSRFAPTYNYRYDFSTRLFDRIGIGATHATEMFAVFGVRNTALEAAITVAGGRRGLRAVTDLVQSNWLNFARYGRPMGKWRPYSVPERATLVFDRDQRIVRDLEPQRRAAWQAYRGRYDTAEASIG